MRTKKSTKFRQSKGNNSAKTDNTTIKLHMHNYHTMAIYIQYKFHDIPSIDNLVITEVRKADGWTDERMDRWTAPNQYTSAFGREL